MEELSYVIARAKPINRNGRKQGVALWTGQDLCRKHERARNQGTQIKVSVLPLNHSDLPFTSYLIANLACKGGKTISAVFTLKEDDIHESTT